MREQKKYAVSSEEIYNDILDRLKNKPNVVTICTLKNILKGRAKRGDEDALNYYILYSIDKIKKKCADADPCEITMEIGDIYYNYIKLDVKERDNCTAFEDFEDEYYYGVKNNVL